MDVHLLRRAKWAPLQRGFIINPFAFGGGGPPPETAQTWNPSNLGAAFSLSNGDKTVTRSSGSSSSWAFSTGSKSSGSWYFEILLGAALSSASFRRCGVTPDGTSGSSGITVSGAASQNGSGSWTNGGSASNGSGWSANDVLGFAANFSTGVLAVYKNGAANGSATFNTAVAQLIAASSNDSGNFSATIRTTTVEFSYSPPGGYLPWGA